MPLGGTPAEKGIKPGPGVIIVRSTSIGVGVTLAIVLNELRLTGKVLMADFALNGRGKGDEVPIRFQLRSVVSDGERRKLLEGKT